MSNINDLLPPESLTKKFLVCKQCNSKNEFSYMFNKINFCNSKCMNIWFFNKSKKQIGFIDYDEDLFNLTYTAIYYMRPWFEKQISDVSYERYHEYDQAILHKIINLSPTLSLIDKKSCLSSDMREMIRQSGIRMKENEFEYFMHKDMKASIAYGW